MAIHHEIADSESGPIHRAMERFRGFMGRHYLLRIIYRSVVITLGLIFILAGIIMLVTPGPGWLFIFLGMGLWGTEFHWAHRLNVWAKAKVLAFFHAAEARRYKRRLAKRNALWQQRGNTNHYCPTGCHYH